MKKVHPYFERQLSARTYHVAGVPDNKISVEGSVVEPKDHATNRESGAYGIVKLSFFDPRGDFDLGAMKNNARERCEAVAKADPVCRVNESANGFTVYTPTRYVDDSRALSQQVEDDVTALTEKMDQAMLDAGFIGRADSLREHDTHGAQLVAR